MREKKIYLVALIPALFFALAGYQAFGQSPNLPPLEAGALKQLENSPRHGEWVTVDTGGNDKVDAWIVYPERKDKAPVVIVIHEIFGLNDWARAVTDQLAAEGFIAVAPDFLSGKGPDGRGSRGISPDAVRGINSALDMGEVTRRIDAIAAWAMNLPAAQKRFGVVGFCWGGGISFLYATRRPDIGAAVVYYGTSPATETLGAIKAPVLGLYGGDDARVNATVPAADAEMKRLGKRYEFEMYPGAGHAFLRQQDGRNGANLEASINAWPRTIRFLKELIGR